MRPTLLVRALGLALVCCVYSPWSYGQNILLVQYKNKPAVVRAARGNRPLVEEKGKLVVAAVDRYALRKVEEFSPVFISVRNLMVRTTAVRLMDSAQTINNQFEFRAQFVSAYGLDDVFLVLELKFEDDTKRLFLHEVGRMDANASKSLDLVVPTGIELGRGNYQIHLFVNGLEVLHSEQPFAFREGALDRMVAKRTANRKDGPPAFLVGPTPEYPTKLFKAKTKGKAIVRVRVRPTGSTLDPTLVEATTPAFGESAINAVRQWRFLPAMKNGRAIETTVDLPIEFEPVAPTDDK